MPRAWIITLQDYPDLNPRKWNRLQVDRIEKAERDAIEVELLHIEPAQIGRRHCITLPPPLPCGLSHDFFAACGFDCSVGAELKPKDAIAKIALARFAKNTEGKDEIVAFKPPPQEKNNDNAPEQPASTTDTAGKQEDSA